MLTSAGNLQRMMENNGGWRKTEEADENQLTAVKSDDKRCPDRIK